MKTMQLKQQNESTLGKWCSGLRLITMMGVMTTVVGCAGKTDPFSADDRFARATADLASMYEGQEAVNGPITIGEAIARALKYNLDHRLKKMETALAVRNYEFDKTGMLPTLIAGAGYSRRSNDPGARSIDVETGEETLPASQSVERTRETSDIVLTWNILDFGLSYYTAKQNADEILVAEERRRKTIQNISQDVIDSFWKAWMAQTLAPKIDALLAEASSALDKSRDLVKRGVQDSSSALRSQSGLLNTMNSLMDMREQVALSRTRLAALLNIKPGTEYQVSPPSTMDVPGGLRKGVDELAQQALLNRPELREEDYRKRITQVDAKKAFLKLFPNLNFTAGYYRDENEFLVNRDWEDVGVDLSWNLLGIMGAKAEKRFHEASVDVADARRVALSLAVMTQVYLSVSRYEMARARYASSSDLYEIRSHLARNDSNGGSRSSAIEALDSRASALASEMRRSLAFAETQASFARVINSAGIDPIPEEVESHDLKVLSDAFNQRWSQMVKGALIDY